MLIDEFVRAIDSSLAERVRVLHSAAEPVGGEFVLYWMRTAIRVDENPALSVAVQYANRTGQSLLVIQSVSQDHPYASDRHHTFVLQSARDVEKELANQGIPYALYVERAGQSGSPLRELARRAACVITEEMPVEPFRSWSENLGRGLNCHVLAVDTACVVPMQLVGESYDRAFAYRNATKELYRQRVRAAPIQVELESSSQPAIELPLGSIDLQSANITDVVSQCEIDHSVGPVPHTVGGSAAGYQRWNEFKCRGLAKYAQLRNNALTDGVSRMSPYLHYGMVSPLRIAREAAAERGSGAEKYLDELLIWRELAYAFCFFRHDYGTMSALPQWAIQTLLDHESDERTELLSWETMARGHTGDSLWDSAQKSLLIHGELHNNVRMTWGKAILTWTPDAKNALARIIDLNHRYALDGRDPASYGGILWCLGQFDRAFSSAQPVFGKLRSRSTRQHSQRLDPVAYRRKVTRPLCQPMPSVAVVGAGLSGLMCARTLTDHGFDVKVFEKSRGVGGRMSTRRTDDNLHFDHGAQYFTARDNRFKRYVESWIDDGLVQPWEGRIVTLEKGAIKEEKQETDRYVAVPSMNAIGKHLAVDLDVQSETRLAPLKRLGDQWSLCGDDGSDLGRFDVAVVATPAPQAASLIGEAPKLAQRARSATMSGCWAVMLALEEESSIEFDAAFVHQSPLSWIARNSSKPGRAGDVETWVLHATPQWTSDHLNQPADVAERLLVDEFWRSIGRSPAGHIYAKAHLWRFALPVDPLPVTCLFDRHLQIGACGDWCGGPRVEGAFLSGAAMAGRVMGMIEASRSGRRQSSQLELSS